jgi:signal transduction histidine kinase
MRHNLDKRTSGTLAVVPVEDEYLQPLSTGEQAKCSAVSLIEAWESLAVCPDSSNKAVSWATVPPLLRDLHATLDSIEDPLFVVDGRGKILFYNQPAAPRLINEKQERPLSIVDCKGELWTLVREYVRRARESHAAVQRRVRVQDPSGWWLISVRELQSSTSGAQRLAVFLRDITADETLRQDLKLSESMARSGLLLAGAAHQAKNLLFGLTATLEAFQAVHARQLSSDDPHLQSLKDGVTRLETMIRNIFDQSRPLDNLEPASLTAIVDDAIEGCRQLATACSVNICMGGPHDVEVQCQGQLLTRAIENVLDNSVRYSSRGSTVTVDVERLAPDAEKVRITIADHGPGFHPDAIKNLGTPFFSRRPGGTGLGLAAAHKIIADHGGEMMLANSEPGGAVVTILLPAHSPSARPAEAARAN